MVHDRYISPPSNRPWEETENERRTGPSEHSRNKQEQLPQNQKNQIAPITKRRQCANQQIGEQPKIKRIRSRQRRQNEKEHGQCASAQTQRSSEEVEEGWSGDGVSKSTATGTTASVEASIKY